MNEICKICGGALQAMEDEYCKSCDPGQIDEYKTVREYLRSNPNSNAMQVATATGISVSKIMRYIRNGSLTIADNNGIRR